MYRRTSCLVRVRTIEWLGRRVEKPRPGSARNACQRGGGEGATCGHLLRGPRARRALPPAALFGCPEARVDEVSRPQTSYLEPELPAPGPFYCVSLDQGLPGDRVEEALHVRTRLGEVIAPELLKVSVGKYERHHGLDDHRRR